MWRPPRKYGSRLRLAASPAPQAREEAETSERRRWASELGKLVSTTPTPAATLLPRTPEALDRLGAGRRVNTSRSRVRCRRRFLHWLREARDITMPTGVAEGAPRSELKCFKASLAFFRAGNEEKDKVSIKQLVVNSFEEVLLRASQGRPFFPTGTTLQSWGVVRFDDHHGFHPRQLVLDGRGLTATLHRTKTTGEGKEGSLRPLCISRSSWVGGRSWVETGLELMNKFMNFVRDHLWPSPSSDGFG